MYRLDLYTNIKPDIFPVACSWPEVWKLAAVCFLDMHVGLC